MSMQVVKCHYSKSAYRIESLNEDLVLLPGHDRHFALLTSILSCQDLNLHDRKCATIRNNRCPRSDSLTKSPRTIFHFVIGSGGFLLCPRSARTRAAAAVHGRQDISSTMYRPYTWIRACAVSTASADAHLYKKNFTGLPSAAVETQISTGSKGACWCKTASAAILRKR